MTFELQSGLEVSDMVSVEYHCDHSNTEMRVASLVYFGKFAVDCSVKTVHVVIRLYNSIIELSFSET